MLGLLSILTSLDGDIDAYWRYDNNLEGDGDEVDSYTPGDAGK